MTAAPSKRRPIRLAWTRPNCLLAAEGSGAFPWSFPLESREQVLVCSVLSFKGLRGWTWDLFTRRVAECFLPEVRTPPAPQMQTSSEPDLMEELKTGLDQKNATMLTRVYQRKDTAAVTVRSTINPCVPSGGAFCILSLSQRLLWSSCPTCGDS